MEQMKCRHVLCSEGCNSCQPSEVRKVHRAHREPEGTSTRVQVHYFGCRRSQPGKALATRRLHWVCNARARERERTRTHTNKAQRFIKRHSQACSLHHLKICFICRLISVKFVRLSFLFPLFRLKKKMEPEEPPSQNGAVPQPCVLGGS